MTCQKQGSFWSIVLSVMLILLGFLLLLNTFNVLGEVTGLFLAGMFGLGAGVGLTVYLQNRQQWWLLIPSGISLGLSGFFAIDAFPFLNRRIDEVGFMMLAFALTCWVIYLGKAKQKWAFIPASLFTFVAIMVTVDRPEFFLALMFGLAALFGFRYYAKNNQHWWIVLPSAALLGVANILALESLWFLNPGLEEGSLMLFALALGFWIIYITQRQHWWAGIPAGILTTLAFMVALDGFVHTHFHATFLMLGFAMTFGMLWIRREKDGTRWAIWPTVVLAGIGFIAAVGGYLNLLWPLALIGAGIWLMRRNLPQSQTNLKAER